MRDDSDLPATTLATRSVASESGAARRPNDDSLIEPVALLPAQFFAESDWRALARGEVALCGAILADAIECFHAYRESRDVELRRLARQAERWLFGELGDAPFSMQRVCDALGVDAERVRRSLAPRRGGPAGALRGPVAQRFVRGAGRRRLRA